jgi:hypothetical protein
LRAVDIELVTYGYSVTFETYDPIIYQGAARNVL